jgi:hypothetical protein
MKRTHILAALFAMALSMIALPAIASAQYGQYDPYGRNGQYDPYSRNGGYYGNGQYGDMRNLVRSLKSNASELQRHLDNDLDSSRYNGSRREDQLNELARRFRSEVNGLSESNNRYNDYRRRDGRVDRVLNLGDQLGRALSRTRMDHHIRGIWSQIDRDLNVLAQTNGYNRNGRYGSGGYNNGGSRNLPSWWPF